MTPSDAVEAGPEQQRWQAELRLRERELDIKERAAAQDAVQKAREFDAKLADQRWARWTNPLVLAVSAAVLAALGNAWLAYYNGAAQRELETTRNDGQLRIENSKAEAARILEVIKTDDTEKAAVNLAFLLDAGLITDDKRKAALKSFLDKRQPGEGPSIPPIGAVVPQGPPDQPMSRVAEVDLLARLIYTEVRGEIPGNPAGGRQRCLESKEMRGEISLHAGGGHQPAKTIFIPKSKRSKFPVLFGTDR